MTIKLRKYQHDAVAAVRADLDAGVMRPAVVLPTGGGKTIVFADMMAKEARRGKSLIIAHTNELIGQAVAKYRDVNPGAAVGVVKAEQNETDAPVIVSSVQTLSRPNRRAQLEGVGLIVIDECHRATAQSYRDVLDHYGVPAVGFTATLARGDGKALGDVWEKISYQMPLLRMIRMGYLADVKGVEIRVPDLDLKGLGKSAGDYREGELGERLQASIAPQTVAQAYRQHGVRPDGGVRPGILFAPTVATAQLFADALCAEGFRAVAVWGDMPKAERTRILGDPAHGVVGAFDRGEYDVLCNAMILTIGFDSPRAEVAVIARPTQSSPLYVQMVGRVLRLYPGKEYALVLDVVGAAGKHELCTLATLAGERIKDVKESKSLLQALDETGTDQCGTCGIPREDCALVTRTAEYGCCDECTHEPEAEGGGYVGDVVSQTVDLFAGSRQQWLQTFDGHWFIPAGERIITLVPARGGVAFDVVWFAVKTKGGGYVARDVMDLGMAMAHGEGEITWDEEMMAAKDRAWRKRRRTEKQLGYARMLGIKVDQLPENMRAGQLGDLISIALASKRVDKLIKAKRS